MKAHYKTSIAISLIVIIVLVILRTTVTGQDSIKFIDDTDDQPIDQQNSDSIDLVIPMSTKVGNKPRTRLPQFV